MVADRDGFLAAGHYDFIAAALAAAARPGDGPGPGRRHRHRPYLARVLTPLPARPASASTSPSRPCAAPPGPTRGPPPRSPTCGARCRLADAAAALILNVFAPRNGPEFRRVLRPGRPAAGGHPGRRPPARAGRPRYGLIRVDPDKADRVARGARRSTSPPEAPPRHRRTLHLTAARGPHPDRHDPERPPRPRRRRCPPRRRRSPPPSTLTRLPAPA